MMQIDKGYFRRIPGVISCLPQLYPFPLKSLWILTTHWFQDAAGSSCAGPVFPNDPSAWGFDSWFCLSFPLEDRNPALNPRWGAWSARLFLPAPCARAVVFPCSPEYTWTAIIACSQTQATEPSKIESTCGWALLVLLRRLIFLAWKPSVAFCGLVGKVPDPH